jgi:hypothetical protein
MRDQVELTDSEIRIHAAGYPEIVKELATEYGRSFDDIEEALAIDDYVVINYDGDDIVGIERDTFDDSFAGGVIWKAIAPYVDAGNYLVYRESYDGGTYKVLFDGNGGFETLTGRVVYE